MKSQSRFDLSPAEYAPAALAVFAVVLALFIGVVVVALSTAAQNAPRRDSRAAPNRCPLNCHVSGAAGTAETDSLVPSAGDDWTAAGRMYAAPPSAAFRKDA